MQLTPWKKFRAAKAWVTIVRDPLRLDEILALADQLAENDETLDRFREDPLVQKVIAQPVMQPLPDPEVLIELPTHTVGHAYARMMRDHSLSPEPLAYAAQTTDLDKFKRHMRLSHDLWHVATGFDVDISGELGLQAFMLAQLNGPFPLAILSAGLLHTLLEYPESASEVMESISRGWQLGRAAEPLPGVDWHAWLDQPLDAFRETHRLQLAA